MNFSMRLPETQYQTMINVICINTFIQDFSQEWCELFVRDDSSGEFDSVEIIDNSGEDGVRDIGNIDVAVNLQFPQF